MMTVNGKKWITGSAVALFPIVVNQLLVWGDSQGKVTFITAGLVSCGLAIVWAKLVQVWATRCGMRRGTGAYIAGGLAVLVLSMLLCNAAIPESVPVHYHSGMWIMLVYHHAMQALGYTLVMVLFPQGHDPSIRP